MNGQRSTGAHHAHMPRRRPLAWLLLGLAVLFTSGCRTLPAPFAEDTELPALKTDAPALSDVRVALTPIRLHYPTQRSDAAMEADPGWAAIRPDPIRWNSRLESALKEHAGVEVAPPLRYRKEKKRSDLLIQALDKDIDVLVQIDLNRFRYEFRGRNGSFWPNMIMWWLLWVPSFFVCDEDFGAVIQGEIELIDVRSEESVAKLPLTVDDLIALDDFERGFDILGVFTAPDNLDADDWDVIGETFGPIVEERVALSVVKGVLRDLAPKAQALPASTFAVVASIPQYKNATALPAVRAAKRDAERFQSAAVISAGVPIKNVTTLNGSGATRASMEAAVRKAAGHARSQDTLLLFFAGAGTQSGDQLYLLPYDADPKDLPRTAIPLDELGRWLADSSVGRVVVMTDTSFAAEAGLPRTLAGSGGTLDPAVEISRALPGRQVYVLTAGDSTEGAHDLAGKAQGLFTFYLVKGITGAANANRDPVLSLEELRKYVAQFVSDQAGLDGQRQNPTLYSTTDEEDAAKGSWIPRAKVPFVGN
ncbi:MAG: caspase family protein [Planctomycetota bacterium]|jgi:hypothetical protein